MGRRMYEDTALTGAELLTKWLTERLTDTHSLSLWFIGCIEMTRCRTKKGFEVKIVRTIAAQHYHPSHDLHPCR